MESPGEQLLFLAGGALCGVPKRQAFEVLPVPKVTPIPNSGEAMLGISKFRNEVIPVIDLAFLLGRSDLGWSRAVVVEVEGEHVGLAASEVLGLAEVELQQEPRPHPLPSAVVGVWQTSRGPAWLLSLPALMRSLSEGS